MNNERYFIREHPKGKAKQLNPLEFHDHLNFASIYSIHPSQLIRLGEADTFRMQGVVVVEIFPWNLKPRKWMIVVNGHVIVERVNTWDTEAGMWSEINQYVEDLVQHYPEIEMEEP